MTEWYGQIPSRREVNSLSPIWRNCLSRRWKFSQKLNIHRLGASVCHLVNFICLEEQWLRMSLILQDSVITTIVKLCLKSLQEFVRLQTFNRSGFQQIQLDIHFLKTTLKDTADDEAAVDFLLDEVMTESPQLLYLTITLLMGAFLYFLLNGHFKQS